MELHLEMTDGGWGPERPPRAGTADDENSPGPEQPSAPLGDRETRLRGRRAGSRYGKRFRAGGGDAPWNSDSSTSPAAAIRRDRRCRRLRPMTPASSGFHRLRRFGHLRFSTSQSHDPAAGPMSEPAAQLLLARPCVLVLRLAPSLSGLGYPDWSLGRSGCRWRSPSARALAALAIATGCRVCDGRVASDAAVFLVAAHSCSVYSVDCRSGSPRSRGWGGCCCSSSTSGPVSPRWSVSFHGYVSPVR